MEFPWKDYAQLAYQRFSNQLNLPEINSNLCIACSGGADSVCLTLLMSAIFPNSQLNILHYNHSTRGEETDRDEYFVKTLAQALEIPFFSQKRKGDDVTEAALRQARYTFFENTMRRIGSQHLLTAHHANDVIETMLMRCFRGSSEIAAPKFIQEVHGLFRIRPLLTIPKKQILDFLKSNHIPWREDQSNSSNDYLRNRIRNVLNHFNQITPNNNWEDGFLASYHFLCEDSDCLNDLAQTYIQNPQQLDLSKVHYPAIIRRAIHLWLQCEISASCFEKILSALQQETPQKISINKDLNLLIHHRTLTKQFASPKIPYHFNRWINGDLYLPTGQKLSKEIISFHSEQLKNPVINRDFVFLNSQFCKNLTIRNWIFGDHYRPISSPEKSLKKLFSDYKIPQEERHSLPIICDDRGQILWVPGLPPADFAKVRDNFAVKITFSST